MKKLRNFRSGPGWALWLLVWMSLPAASEELRLDARALHERSVTMNVRLSRGGTALELERGNLFEDDGPAAGYSYKANEERLGPGIRIKKIFELGDPRGGSATLLIAPGGDLQALVNGKPAALEFAGKAGQYWQAYRLPPEVLRAGENDVVIHGKGKVWIARDDEFAAGSRERTRHPNRSAKSSDEGKTWDFDRLGPKGDIDGEYYLRLFRDQHRTSGSLRLPVLDIGNLQRRPLASPLGEAGPLEITLEGETGKSGSLALRVRSGAAPIPNERDWTAWQKTRGGRVAAAGRYVEVIVDLDTADPSTTPTLTGLVISAAPKHGIDWTKSVRVLESHNKRIVRSSIPFTYEAFDHPRLKELRERHRLDEVVSGVKSEMELIGRLAAWSARQWQRGHLRDAYPPWDALEILKPHADGTPVGGFCQQYNIVFLQACQSFGLVGRAVSLGPGDYAARIRSGHEVVEIWSNEHRKWVYVDGQKAWYFVDAKTAAPLSLLELRERQLAFLRGKDGPGTRIVTLAKTDDTWSGLGGFPPFVELRLIPRNDFLSQRSPLPLNQGMRGWFWTGHHVWSDEHTPAALLYGNRVSDQRNWEWTLNQTAIYLAATDTPGSLRVHLDTETPGFRTFLADIDGAGEQTVKSGFLWRLRRGENRLSVRTRNAADCPGTPSSVRLAW